MAGDTSTGKGMFNLATNITTSPLDFGDCTNLPSGTSATNMPFNNRYCKLYTNSASQIMIPAGSQPERASVFWNAALSISVFKGHYYTGGLQALPATSSTVTSLTANGSAIYKIWKNTGDISITGSCWSPQSYTQNYMQDARDMPVCPTGFTETSVGVYVGKSYTTSSTITQWGARIIDAAGADQIRHPGTYDAPTLDGIISASVNWACYQIFGWGCPVGYYTCAGLRLCSK